MIRRPPSSPLFPSPPLSRSLRVDRRRALRRRRARPDEGGFPAAAARAVRRIEARGRGVRRDVGAVLRPAEHRSEEHTSELQSRLHLVCRLLLEKKKTLLNSTRLALSHDDVRKNTSETAYHSVICRCLDLPPRSCALQHEIDVYGSTIYGCHCDV